jgi:uncharacterized membrane protein YoaK (UPF0700 family)
MSIGAPTLAVVFVLWAVLTIAVAVLTARAARHKTDSPGLLLVCSLLLALFPPLNVLALTVLAMLPDRRAATKDG